MGVEGCASVCRTVGVAGHVDHGKTSLVRCLTGIDTDRRPEEKRRGMSIEPGVAPMSLPDGRTLALVDVPGHVDFLKNTIRGLHGVDAAVLVVAADDGVMPQTREHLDADLEMLSRGTRALRNRQRVRLHMGTAAVGALAVLMTGERLEPGTRGLVQFRLAHPMAALPRDRFVVAPLNTNTVMGGGIVLETPVRKFRRSLASECLPLLEALWDGDPGRVVERFFDRPWTRPVTVRELGRVSGLPLLAIESEVHSRVRRGELVYLKGQGAMRYDRYDALKSLVQETVEAIIGRDPLQKALSPGAVAAALPAVLDSRLFVRLLDELCQEQKLARVAGGFHLPEAVGRFSPERDLLARQIEDHVRRNGLVPFSADTFWKSLRKVHDKGEVQRLMDFLAARGRLVRLGDNRFLHPESLAAIKLRVRQAIAEKGAIGLGDCTEILGYGRWGGAPVLDYLNRIGFTRRVGNQHLLDAANPKSTMPGVALASAEGR